MIHVTLLQFVNICYMYQNTVRSLSWVDSRLLTYSVGHGTPLRFVSPIQAVKCREVQVSVLFRTICRESWSPFVKPQLWVQHVSASGGMSWTWGGQVISFFRKSWRKDTVGKISEGPKVPYGSLVLVGCVPIALRTWREDTAKQNERGLCGNRPGSGIYGLFPEGTPYKL